MPGGVAQTGIVHRDGGTFKDPVQRRMGGKQTEMPVHESEQPSGRLEHHAPKLVYLQFTDEMAVELGPVERGGAVDEEVEAVVALALDDGHDGDVGALHQVLLERGHDLGHGHLPLLGDAL